MTSYLRRIVPMCNLNSKFAKFIPAQLPSALFFNRDLLSWTNGERKEICLHFGSFVVPTFGDDFIGFWVDLGIVVLSPGLNADFGHGRNVVSVQGHRVGVMSLERARYDGIQSENFLTETIEIRKFQQLRDGESFVGIGESFNQLLAKFMLDIGLHSQFESDV